MEIEYIDKKIIELKSINSYAVFLPSNFLDRYPDLGNLLLDPNFYNLPQHKQIDALNQAIETELNKSMFGKIPGAPIRSEIFINILNFFLASNKTELAALVLTNEKYQANIFHSIRNSEVLNDAINMAIKIVYNKISNLDKFEPPTDLAFLHHGNAMTKLEHIFWSTPAPTKVYFDDPNEKELDDLDNLNSNNIPIANTRSVWINERLINNLDEHSQQSSNLNNKVSHERENI